MTEHVTWLTEFVNHHFGRFALALLSALHIKPTNPELPIPEHVIMAMVVLLVGTVLALVLRSKLSVEKPGAMQQVAELLLTNPMGFGIMAWAATCLLLRGRLRILVLGYWPFCFFLSRLSAPQRVSCLSLSVSGRTCSPAISSI